jgi:GR25 family glycosyltransferase involved in LPS biosynthesis
MKSLVTPKAFVELQKAERVKYRSKHYELTRGAVGCWLSHVRLWRDFLETDKNTCLIFEDDAYMVTDMIGQLMHVRPPKNWDIVLLGYVCNRCEDEQGIGDMIRVNKFFGLHCYMINRGFVQKFFKSKYSKRVGKQIDSVLSDMIAEGDIQVYASRQKLAWQNNRHGTRIQMPIRITPGIDVWANE